MGAKGTSFSQLQQRHPAYPHIHRKIPFSRWLFLPYFSAVLFPIFFRHCAANPSGSSAVQRVVACRLKYKKAWDKLTWSWRRCCGPLLASAAGIWDCFWVECVENLFATACLQRWDNPLLRIFYRRTRLSYIFSDRLSARRSGKERSARQLSQTGAFLAS